MSSNLKLQWKKYLAYGGAGAGESPWAEAWEARSGPYALHVYTDRTSPSRVGVRGAWSQARTLEPRADVVDAMREVEALFLGGLKEWTDAGVCPAWLMVHTEYAPALPRQYAPAPSENRPHVLMHGCAGRCGQGIPLTETYCKRCAVGP